MGGETTDTVNVEPDDVLDVQGENCPIPVIRTKQRIDELEPGGVLEVQATDPGAERDIPSWADTTDNEFLGVVSDGDVLRLYIRRN